GLFHGSSPEQTGFEPRLTESESAIIMGRSLNFHSAPCIAVQRGAKFGGALPQPFVCLADRTRPMWIEIRVSVSDHCQRFGNCLGLAISARRMEHCFVQLPATFPVWHQ